MPVDIGQRQEGPGWGCSCRSFRLGEPDPQVALKRLADSANVTVEDKGSYRDGTHHFEAWTDPASRYEVTFDPGGGGGWCKHILACVTHSVPWFQQVALGAGWALDEIDRVTKENKRLTREAKKRDREIAKLRG